MKKFAFAVLATSLLTASAFAQSVPTPLNPPPVNYDGTCTVNSVSAVNTVMGAGNYSNNGSFTFNCTGTFRSWIRATITLHDPRFLSAPVSTDPSVASGMYAMKQAQWPITGTSCTTTYGLTLCMPYVIEAKPVNKSLSLVTTTTVPNFVTRGSVTWVSGPCTTQWGQTYCPTTSVAATKNSY